MGTVLRRGFYPWYLSLPVIAAPFIRHILESVNLCLPTIPRAGRDRFPIYYKTEVDDFVFVEDTQRDLESLPERCALVSRIPWWKNIALQIAYLVAMAPSWPRLLFVTHL